MFIKLLVIANVPLFYFFVFLFDGDDDDDNNNNVIMVNVIMMIKWLEIWFESFIALGRAKSSF